ncbi:MAG: TIGR00725 family protein [Solirubrobacterales bacterium]
MTVPARQAQVAVIGAHAPAPGAAAIAEELGQALAWRGLTVVCGGRGGVMEAAARGAYEAGGTVIGVLPGEDPAAANPWCTHVVATGTGTARNLAVVCSADVVVAVAGAWGTLSEIALARCAGREVIGLATWEMMTPGGGDPPGVVPVADVSEAMAAVERLLGRSPSLGTNSTDRFAP